MGYTKIIQRFKGWVQNRQNAVAKAREQAQN